VDYIDKTKIVIQPQNDRVYYKNKLENYSVHNLESALNEGYPEMVKRLKYAKDLLTYMKNTKEGEIKEGLDLRLSMAPNGGHNLMNS